LRLPGLARVVGRLLLCLAVLLAGLAWVVSSPSIAETPFSVYLYSSAEDWRGALYAFLAGCLLLAVTALSTRGKAPTSTRAQVPRDARRLVAVALSCLGVGLLVVSAAITLVPPPQRSYAFSNRDFQIGSSDNLGAWKSTIIEAHAGEMVNAQYVDRWYLNSTMAYIGLEGRFPGIVPADAVGNSSQWGETVYYVVPRDGAYLLTFFADACAVGASVCDAHNYTRNYTSVSSLNVTVMDPVTLPRWQLACGISGAVVWTTAILLDRKFKARLVGDPDRLVRPAIRVREAAHGPRPPRSR
jgi:hypothetical protein